jgi:hypothetical protein
MILLPFLSYIYEDPACLAICRGADKSLAFPFPIFLFVAQPKKKFSWMG